MPRTHTVIVGGTKGIGLALAKTLARQNHLVSVIGRNRPSKVSVGTARVRHWPVDLSERERLLKTLLEIVKTRGKVSNLILCQRYRGGGNAWTGEMEISLSMTKIIVEKLAGHFTKTGGASIVVVGSIASRFVAEEQPVSYHVAKAGLQQMVRYYAVSLGRRGIRVNAVSPATILKEESREFYSQNESLCELYRKITPLGRMGTSEDVCNVINFLCSPAGSFVTGQNIIVDGGISLQWHESMARALTSLNNLSVTRQTEKGAS